MDTTEREELVYGFNEALEKAEEYRRIAETYLREYIRAVCEAKGVEQIDFNVNTDYPRFRNKALNIKGHILAVKAGSLDNRIYCLTGRIWPPMDQLCDIRLDEVMDSVEVYDRTVKDAV